MIDPRGFDEALQRALPAGALYAVGGRVRDEIRASFEGVVRPAKDLDYVVVGVPLDELIACLRRVGRADVVGASFAVVKVTLEGTTVDVALPRREHSTGAGHRDFQVQWGPDVPLEDDLARRDFRMNMLARAISTGELVDPYGGQADIAARRIDVLAPAVFREDPLRMLRACQFAARFEYALSATAFEGLRASAALVATVSPERVRDEMMKLLTARRPSLGLELMRKSGLLDALLPEVAEGVGVTQNVYHAFDVYRHGLATLDATPPEDLTLRLAALLHDVGKARTKSTEDGEACAHFYRHEIVGEEITRALLERLHFPSETLGAVARLVRQHMYAADPALEAKTLRRFVRRIGLDLLDRQFALRAADIEGSGLPRRGDDNERFEERVRAVVAEKPAMSVRDLALSGTDVIAALVRAGRLAQGSRGGREVGETLKALLERVTDEPTLNQPERLSEILESLLSS